MFKTNVLAVVSLLICSLFLTGCNEVLDYRNAEVSHGAIYQKGENTPFTGKVTNIPYSSLATQETIAVTSMIGRVIYDTPAARIASIQNTMGAEDTLCDVSVDNGVIDGAVTCKAGGNGNLAAKFNMAMGRIDGKFELYSVLKNGTKVGEANFSNGQLEGVSRVLNPNDGKVIFTATWHDGVTSDFDLATGEIKTQATDISTNDTDACVSGWIKADRKAAGEDTIVTVDQTDEWEKWCKAGKQPPAA